MYSFLAQTWFKKYLISDWNISAILKLLPNVDEIEVNKTNNGLERLNRELNHLFPNPHPYMVEFVQTIRSLSQKKWKQHDRIAKKKERAPEREPVVILVLPENFAAFVYNS